MLSKDPVKRGLNGYPYCGSDPVNQIATIKLQTAGNSNYGLRFYGGNANAEGRYLFETFSPLTNRWNLALPYEWNSMTSIKQFQVRNGTTIIAGNASAQRSFVNQYIGGAMGDLIKCQ